MRPARTVRARKLRSEMTRVEWRLWSRISRRQLAGFKFRRQAPIGPYTVDFYCPARRLVIEIDGPQHADAVPEDAERDRWLSSHGYRVLRFSADEAFDETDGVLEVILREVGRGMPLPPSGTSP
jgi:very-short-patch-repair endonuclease